MKAITLHQPWASLIALGAKRYETRTWRAHHVGWLAIHAAVTKDGWDGMSWGLRRICQRLGLDRDSAPHGAVVAIADLTGCVRMGPDMIADVGPEERLVGGWEPGRIAWVLSDIHRLTPPYRVKGAQGLWTLAIDLGSRI